MRVKIPEKITLALPSFSRAISVRFNWSRRFSSEVFFLSKARDIFIDS